MSPPCVIPSVVLDNGAGRQALTLWLGPTSPLYGLRKVYINIDAGQVSEHRQRAEKAERELAAAKDALMKCQERLQLSTHQYLELLVEHEETKAQLGNIRETFNASKKSYEEVLSLCTSLHAKYWQLSQVNRSLRWEQERLLGMVEDSRSRKARAKPFELVRHARRLSF